MLFHRFCSFFSNFFPDWIITIDLVLSSLIFFCYLKYTVKSTLEIFFNFNNWLFQLQNFHWVLSKNNFCLFDEILIWLIHCFHTFLYFFKQFLFILRAYWCFEIIGCELQHVYFKRQCKYYYFHTTWPPKLGSLGICTARAWLDPNATEGWVKSSHLSLGDTCKQILN